jgi:hypothetical protein
MDMAVARFERFFREAAGLDVDKSDLKRYSDFVHAKLYDLLLIGVANAKANGRDVVQRSDLPVTKGLRECVHAFRRLDEEIELQPILHAVAARPLLDLPLADEVESRLPELVGGLSVALARSFKQIDPSAKNPRSEHWERAFALFDLLL